MIEFKAECGHTVRARDEDAGKKVKCSYCGKDSPVPGQDEDDLDFLFHEIEDSAPVASKSRMSKRKRSVNPFVSRSRGDGSAMDIALKFIYAAVLIGVVVIVSKKLILPYYEELSGGGVQTQIDFPGDDDRPREPSRDSSRSKNGGLAGLNGRGGLYIASFPPDATAYYIQGKLSEPNSRVSDMNGCERIRTDSEAPVSEGVYVVEVVLPWNAPSLTQYEDYNSTLRRQLENASSAGERDQIVQSYFMPDGAARVFVSEADDQIYIVRQFRDVHMRSGRWTAVHALFIPASVGVEGLVSRVAHVSTQYKFDEDHVRSELEYYNVAAGDRMFVLDLLKRIGVIPYLTVDPQTNVERTRLFKIGVEDGMFSAPVLD